MRGPSLRRDSGAALPSSFQRATLRRRKPGIDEGVVLGERTWRTWRLDEPMCAECGREAGGRERAIARMERRGEGEGVDVAKRASLAQCCRRDVHASSSSSFDASEDLAVERGGAGGAKALGGGETAVAAEEVRLERVGAELDRG